MIRSASSRFAIARICEAMPAWETGSETVVATMPCCARCSTTSWAPDTSGFDPNGDHEDLVRGFQEGKPVPDGAARLPCVLPSDDDPARGEIIDMRRRDEHRPADPQDQLARLDAGAPIVVALLVVAIDHDEIGGAGLLRQVRHRIGSRRSALRPVPLGGDLLECRFDMRQFVRHAPVRERLRHRW